MFLIYFKINDYLFQVQPFTTNNNGQWNVNYNRVTTRYMCSISYVWIYWILLSEMSKNLTVYAVMKLIHNISVVLMYRHK